MDKKDKRLLINSVVKIIIALIGGGVGFAIGLNTHQEQSQSQSQSIIVNAGGQEISIEAKDFEKLNNENSTLKSENEQMSEKVSNLEDQVITQINQIEQMKSSEEISNIIQVATDYWNNSNFIQALTILKNSQFLSTDIEALYVQYSNDYVINLLTQADLLISERKYEDAIKTLQDGKAIVSNDSMLNNKIKEINDLINSKQPIKLSDIKISAYRNFVKREEEFTQDTTGNRYFKGNLFSIYASGKTDYGYASVYLGNNYTSISGIIAVSDESHNRGDVQLKGWIEIGYIQDEKFNTVWKSPTLSRVTSKIEIPNVDISNKEWLEIRYYSNEDYRYNYQNNSLHIILSDLIIYSD